MKRAIIISLLVVGFVVGQTATTIYDIQTDLIDDSTEVEISGIVTTGVDEDHSGSGFHLQDGSGMYSGIFIFGAEVEPARGDQVTVQGTYVEYYEMAEIEGLPIVTINSSGNPVPEPEILTLDQADWEPWESVLLQIQNVSRVGEFDYSEWWVTDGVDTMKIDNSGTYTLEPQIGETFVSITGPLVYNFGAFKVAPRTDEDLVLAAPVIAAEVTIDPSTPVTGETVTISVSITHTIGFSASLSYYSYMGTDTSDVTSLAMTHSEGDVYTAQIPGHDRDFIIDFYIVAEDTEGDSKTSGIHSYTVLPSGGEITPIYDIQYTTDPSGMSPLDGEVVNITGIVTAEFWGTDDNRTIYVQDAEGPWNGILVYRNDGWHSFDFTSAAGPVHTIAEGDSVTLTGTVQDIFGRTRINNVTEVLAYGKAANPMVPSIVTPGQIKTGGTDAEAYEGCLVQVQDVNIATPDLGDGEWEVNVGTDTCRIGDSWEYYMFPAQNAALSSITGIMNYRFSNFKIEPRLARDIAEDGITRIQRVNQMLYSDLLAVTENDTADFSYFRGEIITVQGVVTVSTGLHYAGDGVKFIFEETTGGPWSGLICYSDDPTALGFLPIGRKVQATGVIVEYDQDDYDGNHTEIDITQPILSLGIAPVPGDTIPPADLRAATTGEQWEGVWITVADVYVVENDLPFYGWSIDSDLSGINKVKMGSNSNDTSWVAFENEMPPVGTHIKYVSGWPYHHHGDYSDSTSYKIEPSFVSDVVFDLTAIDTDEPQLVRNLELKPNYPNPFNPTTNIRFSIQNSDVVRLSIFDLRGREVNVLVNQRLGAGEHRVVWNGMDTSNKLVGSGVYLYRLESGGNELTGKMLLLR